MRFARRIVVLAFAVIQLVLVARILLDIGVIPTDLGISEPIISLSDALAAPVERLGEGLGGMLGGGGGVPGFGPVAGDGLNPTMVAALIGWSIVEGLVLGVVRKFAEV